MKAARWRISGMGELVYEWKRSSWARTRLSAAGASLFLKPKAAAAACAKPEDGLVTSCDFGRVNVFFPGLAVLPECIVLVLVIDIDRVRGAVNCLVVERAQCRHIVLSAARAAESIDGAIVVLDVATAKPSSCGERESFVREEDLSQRLSSSCIFPPVRKVISLFQPQPLLCATGWELGPHRGGPLRASNFSQLEPVLRLNHNNNFSSGRGAPAHL